MALNSKIELSGTKPTLVFSRNQNLRCVSNKMQFAPGFLLFRAIILQVLQIELMQSDWFEIG